MGTATWDVRLRPLARRHGSAVLLIAYPAAIALAELTTAAISPSLGLGLHACVLLTLLWAGARSDEDDSRGMFFALMTAPLLRIFSLALPLNSFPQTWWYVIVMVPVWVSAWIAARTAGYSCADLGLTISWRALPLQLLVLPMGLLLGALEFLILQPLPLATGLTWGAVWLPALVLVVATGFGEEVIFRGLLQQAAMWRFGPWRGVLFVTVVFAAMHIGYLSIPDLALVFAAGLGLGWVTWRSGSLLTATVMHGSANVTLFLLAPLWLAPLISR